MAGGALLGPLGGTRAWRRLVAAVLARDGYVCQARRKCNGAPATTGGHKIPRKLGGLDTMDNVQAECVPCNMGDGARIGAVGAVMLARHRAVLALVALLDRWSVPVDATAGSVMADLPSISAHPWHRADVVAAVLHRRRRGPLIRI